MPDAAESDDIILPPVPTPETFPFPYPEPYNIQLDLMRTVFEAIEKGKIAIVESPTGTGKSLTLLTSTLTWLKANQTRLDTAAEDSLRTRLAADASDDPPWVLEHALRSRLAELRAGQEARAARLAAAREKERKRRESSRFGAFRGAGTAKRVRVDYEADASVSRVGIGDGDEGEFLPDDGALTGDTGGGMDFGEMNLSKEVRELMAKYEAHEPKIHVEEEKEEDVPKIYYTSRTHTQLRQLTSELLKTSFPAKVSLPATSVTKSNPSAPETGDSEEGISMVPLASRRQLCINPKVQALGKSGGDERMNEACLDMQKGGKKQGEGGRCEFLPRKDDEGSMLDMRDAILATVRDIEDIVTLGKESCVCPYYATRRSVKQSQLVTLPYNLLLQKTAREALDIDLTNQIVVIDEAHNLIDTLLSIHSTSITSTHLSNANAQLAQYLARFRSRLKPIHSLWIRQTVSVIQGLLKSCERFLSRRPDTKGSKGKGNAGQAGHSDMMDTTALMQDVGGGNDQVNLFELVRYLKDSKLAGKVSGYAEKTAEDSAAKGSKASRGSVGAAARHAATTAFHQVEAFLLALTDAGQDGRIILSSSESTEANAAAPSSVKVVTLKYILLNPAERFKEVVNSARGVILAGGTMEPISDLMLQLFSAVPRDRVSTLSCSHVIPKSNLLTQVVSVGPRKMEFEFKYANRGDDELVSSPIIFKAYEVKLAGRIPDRKAFDLVKLIAKQLHDLGALISSVVGLVPDGVVVFLPSYSFLDRVKAVWSKSGLLERLAARKQLFYEPQTSSDVEAVLRDYALAIHTPTPSMPDKGHSNGTIGRTKGALMFAVVGGKLSEGINFSDALGRCVIMVGLPFANVGSVELKERMKYVEGLPGAGKDASRELYENLCMRAVNQSIGRAIRHANDYATILLVDKRFASSRIRNKLPKWIGEDVQVPADFSGVAKGIAGFFREKRERGA